MAEIKLTEAQKEKLNVFKKVKHYSLIAESNIVAMIFKDTNLIYELDSNFSSDMFLNDTWKTYFNIAKGVIIDDKKEILDEMTIGFYLEKHDKLRESYDKSGGYDTIMKSTEYVNEKNFSGYVKELIKWNTIVNIIKCDRFSISEDTLAKYVDMDINDIYNETSALINHIFINADDDVKVSSISDGIYELIDELNEGAAVGLPFDGMDILNKETGGQLCGNITLIGGMSNSGKTTLTRNMCIPSALKYGEKLFIMLNEEGKKKWQREFLVWTANNIFDYDLQKYIVRDGNYDSETKEVLYKSAEWIKEQCDNNMITIVSFRRYKTSNAIKYIRKYAHMGVKYFILDTYKADSKSSNGGSETWLDMQQNMVDLYDTIKEDGGLNVHLTITFQLSKTSARQRYFQQDNIGMAKNIVDVASTCIMIRSVFEDEYDEEKKSLKCYKFDGNENSKVKKVVKLEDGRPYQLVFIVKNREGSANKFQVVCEHDMSRNILKEIGITNVPVDF